MVNRQKKPFVQTAVDKKQMQNCTFQKLLASRLRFNELFFVLDDHNFKHSFLNYLVICKI